MPPWKAIRAFWAARSRLEKTVAVLLAIVFVLQWVSLGPLLLLGTLLEIATLIAGGILAIRYLRVLTRRMMWRLRHRLLVTYIFIGVVPVLLLLTMAALAAYVFYGQVATYLVGARLAQLQEELSIAARAAARAPVRTPEELADAVRRELPMDLQSLPLEAELATARPEWLKDSFRGLVITPEGHWIRVAVPQDRNTLMITAPASQELLNRIVSGIGTVNFLELSGEVTEKGGSASATGGGWRVKVNEHTYSVGKRVYGGMLREAVHTLDIPITNVLTVAAVDWEKGPRAAPAVIMVTTRPSIINARLFTTLGTSSDLPLTALAAIGIAFLVLEALSLFVGSRLTRSITGAVADLYEGTQRIHSGDFTWRIPVRSNDQLATLAESFNTMTSSLEALIKEQKEKQRMQSELEIAREVQARLFPREVPSLGRLELAGLCQPARTVSGDYYDFTAIDNRLLALAIGDIAGKGISAALLMASIQSMLHAQLPLVRVGLPSASRNGDLSTSEMVTQLNRQLHRSIAPGLFATFCFALYDDASGDLTYTNAGHLPPIIVRRGEVHHLRSGGTVLGIFPGAHYDQETVRLQSGDLFVAFTDGITEPENLYGEEFGEERLLQVLARTAHLPASEIAAAAIAAVREWTGAPEMPDDMTLLIAKRR